MFIFSKWGLKTFHPIKDRINKVSGKIGGNLRLPNGDMKKMSTDGKQRAKYGQRFAIWDQPPMGGNNSGHPAPFPEQLAHDHIISWSNEGDLVYDPFMGSGTTAKMAMLNKRNFIGSETSKEYCDIAEKRINENI
jgi:site-specific DNA-methyltransferase (adenine-specific)